MYTVNTMLRKQKRPSKIDSDENVASAASNWKHIRPRTLEEISRRKQSIPRNCTNVNYENVENPECNAVDTSRAPIESSSINKINAIRYKHLVRMVSKKESCKSCQRDNHCMVLSHHTKRSLLLHRFWRHSNARSCLRCTKCGQLFNKKYKQILHMRLNQH